MYVSDEHVKRDSLSRLPHTHRIVTLMCCLSYGIEPCVPSVLERGLGVKHYVSVLSSCFGGEAPVQALCTTAEDFHDELGCFVTCCLFHVFVDGLDVTVRL